MNPIEFEFEKWSTVKSEYPTRIHNMVFSPSGRWAVDVFRQGAPGDANAVFVHIFDMATMSYKRYNANKLRSVTKVLEIYWVSEEEFVLIDDLGQEKNQFGQVFCHIDHERQCIIPFNGKSLHTPYTAPKFLPQYRGANPLCYNERRYHMLIKGENLVLIPWYGSYQTENDEVLRINMPRRSFGTDFTTYELAFCEGSKIFMPVKQHIQNPETRVCIAHRYVVHEMVVIDVCKLAFVDRLADIRQNEEAISTVAYELLNIKQMRKPVHPVQYRQVGHYLLGYTIDPKTSNPLAPMSVKERSIYMINLRELTISSTTVTSGPIYFPTIYRDQLFLVRNHVNVCRKRRTVTWINEFTIKPMLRREVPTLEQLAQAAQVRYSTPVDLVFSPFIFPKAHCCIPSGKCFCEGILKTSSPKVRSLQTNILNSMAFN